MYLAGGPGKGRDQGRTSGRWRRGRSALVAAAAQLGGRGAFQGRSCSSAHLDTVPVDKSRWSVDPFGAVLKDGYCTDAGAIDDKGMLAANLAVVHFAEALDGASEPRRDFSRYRPTRKPARIPAFER